jgi:anaerobic selenocysteine-containing dehydrogenase
MATSFAYSMTAEPSRSLHVSQNDRGAGTVIVPYGWTWSRTRDGNTVNVLTSDAPTDWGGGVAFFDTLVEVVRLSQD